MSDPTPSALPPAPWSWRDFGSGYELFAADPRRSVVLGMAVVSYVGDWDPPFSVVIGTKDGEGMRPLDPRHPIALLLAAAPEVAAAVEDLLPLCHALFGLIDWAKRPDGEVQDFFRRTRAAAAALEKARAGMLTER